MFRRNSKAENSEVELSDLPPRSSGRTNVRRTGYTPPQFLPSNSTSSLLDIRHALPSLSDTICAEPSSLSAVTTDEFGFPSSSSPVAPRNSVVRSSVTSPDTLDVISAQIQRALGIANDDASEDGMSASALSMSAPDGVEGAVWLETQFRAVLGSDTIDLDEMRRLVWAHGVPERPWMRAIVWKLLVSLLPPDRVDWDTELATRRAEYWRLVSELSAEPSGDGGDGDHPLCDAAGSRWREHFRDGELRTAISRDVLRCVALAENENTVLSDALSRVLFVAAKRRPALRYRQGMHELAAPFLVTFSAEPFADASDAEADAFFAFEAVMREMAAMYASADAVAQHVRELQALLRIKDPELERHLSVVGVSAQFFALRWLRVWLAHELSPSDLPRVWDSLLTAELTLPWLRYVCVAMVIRIRRDLLQGDFAACMKLLLHYPACDIGELLRIADRLRTSNVVIVGRATR